MSQCEIRVHCVKLEKNSFSVVLQRRVKKENQSLN